MKRVAVWVIGNMNFAILALLIVAAAIISSDFLTPGNLLNVLRAASLIGIVAVGMNVVMLTGGIDLSVGSVAAISGAVAASMWSAGDPVLLVAAPLLVGVAVGLVNGVMVTRLHLQPFIATLIMMTVVRGAGLVYTNGQPIYVVYPDFFTAISNGYLLGVPVPTVMFLAITVFTWYLLRFRPFGRYIYAIGSNSTAAFLSGVNVGRIKIIAYVYCGLLAAIAGMVLTSRMKSGEPGQAGVFWELDAIAAVVIGGTSLMGGKGSVWGAFVGALIIGIVANLFNLLGVDLEWQQVSRGLIIFLAVWIHSLEGNERVRMWRASA